MKTSSCNCYHLVFYYTSYGVPLDAIVSAVTLLACLKLLFYHEEASPDLSSLARCGYLLSSSVGTSGRCPVPFSMVDTLR